MSVWDETTVDWSTGEGLQVRQLFERAYDDADAARTVAEAVGIPWPAEALSHAQLWAALLTAAASDARLLALGAELLRDPSRQVFADPLIRALGDQARLVRAAGVAKHGLPELAEEASALVEDTDLASVSAAIVPSLDHAQLESINNAVDKSVSGLAYMRSLMNALRRVGLVSRGQSPVGSGFLVGPDLLLTAAHVVLPRGREVEPRDLETLEVVMDFTEGDQPTAATGSRVRVTELLSASPATKQELGPGPIDDWNAPEDHLDYALLRLARRVGDDAMPEIGGGKRGYFSISSVEPDLLQSKLVLVWHFPEGDPLRTSIMEGAFEYNPAKTRMRYHSDTRPGSSGGPIIDEQGRLLAIHHYGLQPKNQAVPMWRIARATEKFIGREPGPGPASGPGAVADAAEVPKPLAVVGQKKRPYETLLVANQPVVNRDPLRGKLWKAMTKANPPRSLKIVGSADTGVSWSWLLLEHLAAESSGDADLRINAPHGIKAVKIDLRDHITQPVEARRDALINAVGTALASDLITGDGFAQAARQVSNFKEWCRRRLPLDGPQYWLFVDSVDEAGDIEQHGLGELINTLVDLAFESQVNLRLVLAGRKADQLGHPKLGFAVTDPTVGMSRQEVHTWLSAMAVEEGRVVDAQKLEDFLQIWFTTPDQTNRPFELTLALLGAVEEVSA
jgi:S1-C subfamily serine protease